MIMRFPGGVGKALTLSYDDGVEQDEQLIALLDRYGVRCTFNLNSGCYAPEGKVWPAGQIHRRLPQSRVLALYGQGKHEVAVHCLTHASLTELPTDQMVQEVMKDRENLERDFGGIVRGMAYPYGTYNDEVVDTLRRCGILYARTVQSSHQFGIPQDWLRLFPTCHHDDPQLMALADRFVKEPATFGSRLFYLWGHAYEFEANDNWQVMETFCQKVSGRSDIWYATNIDICTYVLAYRQLVYAADGALVYNPTDRQLWLEHEGRILTVEPGRTLRF